MTSKILANMLEVERLDLTQKLRCLYPDSKITVSDEVLKTFYEIWASTARVLDEQSETHHPEAHTPMLPLPPDDEEHRACRAMWAVSIERIISGEDVAYQKLRSVLNFMANTKSWYKHENCACRTRGWKAEEIRQRLTVHYLVAISAEEKGMTINESLDWHDRIAAAAAESLAQEKKAKRASWAFVKSYGMVHPRLSAEHESIRLGKAIRIHDTLFGYYTVTQTSNNYIFTLMEPMHPDDLDLVGTETTIPLSYIMGEGDFQGVTPEKILKA